MNSKHSQEFFLAPFWHRWSYFSILNLSVLSLIDKFPLISALKIHRWFYFPPNRKTPETLRFRGILRLDTCTLRYSIYISQWLLDDCSNTSWSYSTSTFTISDWCIAVCKWWFFVWFVGETPDFPLCPYDFWGFCYHGVITTQLILNLISVYIPSNTLHSLFVLKTYSSYLQSYHRLH